MKYNSNKKNRKSKNVTKELAEVFLYSVSLIMEFNNNLRSFQDSIVKIERTEQRKLENVIIPAGQRAKKHLNHKNFSSC